MRRAFRVVTMALAAACAPHEVFTCRSSADCAEGGFCQPSGHCSTADPECTSGQRYVAHAPDDRADECVGGDVVSGLVGRFALDEGTGLGIENDAGGLPGTLMNGVIWTAGRSGAGLAFDGQDDIAVIPGEPFFFGAGGFSAFAWVRSHDDGVQARILGKGFDNPGPGGYFFLNFGVGAPFLESRDSTGAAWDVGADTDIADDAWHHVGFVIDRMAKRSYFYVDGAAWFTEATNESTGIFGDATATQSFVLGGQNGGEVTSYLGDLDEVWVFARALANADVQLLFEGPDVLSKTRAP